MSGFDDLPGFGAPPPFLQARAAPQGGFGFDAPGFAPAPPSAPAPFGFEAPQFPGLRPPHQHHQHHHQQQQQQQHHQHHAQHQHQQQPTQGSLFGAAPMIGGNGRHQYTPRTFDLPEQTGTGFNAPAAAPQYGGHAAPPQPRFPPASANRDTTNTVWLGFQESFTSDDDLRNHFSQFGKVLRVQRNQAKNCVFVHFLDVDEARRAVESPSTRQFLGPTVKVSYGRMFTYDAEELERMERFEQARANRGGGGGGFRGGAGIGYGEEARDASGAPAGFPPRGPRDAEPTNIVWVGDVTPDITDELLRINFGTFGRVVSVFRSDAKGMAFVHLETVEEAGRAIRGLRSVPIGGKILKLNYGRPQVPRPEFGGGGQQFDRDDREPPTNVVWIGMLAPTVTQADIDALLVGYEGFIDADLFPDRAYSFAHFETIEQAVKCRNALRGQSLHNAPLRVGFGKNNHNRTRADRFGADATAAYSGPAYDQYGMPLLQAPLNPTAAYNNGTLITTVGDRGQLSVLPAEGAPTLPNSTALVPKYVNQPRPTPQVTVDSRVQALGGCSYFKCNVPPPHLMQPAVKEIVEAVDNVTSYNTAEQFLKTLRKYDAPTTLPHLFTVIAKRLKDYHMDDPHKKLHVAYSVALLLHEMPLAKSRSSFDAFCTLLSATSAGQCADGAAHLARLMKSFRKYLNPDVEADALILGQFEHIDKKQRADSDVNNLLKKLQANK